MISREISWGGTRFRVIDLTHPLKLEQEVYPGDSNPKRTVFSDIRKDGWQHYIHELGDHHFQPHADAPNHHNPEMQQRGIEYFGLEHALNAAVLIDLSGAAEAKILRGIRYLREITRSDLEPYESKLREVGAVLVRTGYDHWLEKNLPHDPEAIPGFSEEAAAYLAALKNLKVVGTDSLSVDLHGNDRAHHHLTEKLIVECLVHLHAIPVKARNSFDLQTSPVRIAGATGGPVVAYAWIKI